MALGPIWKRWPRKAWGPHALGPCMSQSPLAAAGSSSSADPPARGPTQWSREPPSSRLPAQPPRRDFHPVIKLAASAAPPAPKTNNENDRSCVFLYVKKRIRLEIGGPGSEKSSVHFWGRYPKMTQFTFPMRPNGPSALSPGPLKRIQKIHFCCPFVFFHYRDPCRSRTGLAGLVGLNLPNRAQSQVSNGLSRMTHFLYAQLVDPRPFGADPGRKLCL